MNSRCRRTLAGFVLISTSALQLSCSGDDHVVGLANPEFAEQIVFSWGNIYQMNPDGTGLSNLTRGQGQEPTVSPDGSTIVFSSYSGGTSQLYSVRSASDPPKTLTSDPGYYNFAPDYSPDGSRVLFTRSKQSGNAVSMWLMDPDGGGLYRLSAELPYDMSAQYGSWSPDGSRIAYLLGRGDGSYNFDIWVANADGTNPVQRTSGTTDYMNGRPSWSPDGSQIAFGLGRNIWVVNAEGPPIMAQRTTYTPPDSSSYAYSPSWSLDGSRIIYTGYVGGSYRLYSINASGGDSRVLAAVPGESATWCRRYVARH